MTTPSRRPHVLAETATAYGSGPPGSGHAKLSITLPADLADQVRQAAEATGTSVSGVIAAALRSTIIRADQDRIDEALEAQNAENLAWAGAFAGPAAQMWSKLDW